MVYVLIKRVLKEYIIEHRDDGSLIGHQFSKRVKRNEIVSLSQAKSMPKQDFIDDFIKEITLGDAENIVLLVKGCSRKFSTDRNILMHSNLYLSKHHMLNRTKRHEENKKLLLLTIDDLEFVLNSITCFKAKLIGTKIG